MSSYLDKLGGVIFAIAIYGLAAEPFATFRANRIVAGEGRFLLDSLPHAWGFLLLGIILVAALVALLRTPVALRFATGIAALTTLAILIGQAGIYLTPTGDSIARISPAAGFWILIFAFSLLVTDALARLNLSAFMRIAALVIAGGAIALLLLSGCWDSLSLLREYGNRADSFWLEGRMHITLALGSLLAAVIAGVPLGILCYRLPLIRGAVLSLLNIIQTIPSIALFGLLIVPIGWIALHVPGAHEIGIRGIGAAPAFVALFLYSLLPVAANTVIGLLGVPEATREAARGMGMTPWQRLRDVEFPLALPVILTGVRIVLVQNIGLATIAALIGGGGFGVFVFQGIGQTAMDLVLLGALPTVALAFAAAVLMDAAIDITRHHNSKVTST